MNPRQIIINKEIAHREFIEGQTFLKSLPSKLIIHSTDRCNLRCVMCGVGAQKGPSLNISQQGLERVFEIFPVLDQVVFTGAEMFFNRGNPSGFVQRIIREGNNYPLLKFGGVTNGTLINNREAQLIVDKFKWLGISIDSPDPEKYSTIRIGSNFRLVCKNIERIRDMKITQGLKAPDLPVLILNFIIMRKTYSDLIDMINLGSILGTQAIQLQVPFKGSIPESEDIFKDIEKVENFLSLKVKAKSLAEKLNMKIIDRTNNTILSNFPHLSNRLECNSTKNLGNYPNNCRLPYEEIFINARGNAYFCCTSPTILGNINKSSISKIWNSPSAVRMRRNLILGDYGFDCKRNCVGCFILPNYINESSPMYIAKTIARSILLA